MSFKVGGYLTVWEIEPVRETIVKARVTSSRKNKQTGEYEDDFSGFVKFCGTATAAKALKLAPRDRIKLGDIEVTRRYDKEKKTDYTDFKIWSFEMANSAGTVAQSENKEVDNGEVENNMPLPF